MLDFGCAITRSNNRHLYKKKYFSRVPMRYFIDTTDLLRLSRVRTLQCEPFTPTRMLRHGVFVASTLQNAKSHHDHADY
jgi:hypothetical protein